MRLDLRQPEVGLASMEQVLTSVRQRVLDEIARRGDDARAHPNLEGQLVRLRGLEFPVRELTREISTLYPGLVSVGVGHEVSVDDASPTPALRPVVVASWRKLPSTQDQARLHT